MIIDKIKADRIQAMKDRDAAKRATLDMVLAAANGIAKQDGTEVSDQHAIAAIRREAKSASKNAEDDRLPDGKRAEAAAEVELLESYLPRQLGERELRELIASFCEPGDVKKVMAELDSRVPGRYDKGMAARIAKGK